MTESAISRTARALDLIPFLLENQGISVAELANEFGISELQILEDLNLLFVCGLPGYSPLELIDMNFEDGFVTVSDPQVLDKPRKLTKPELTTLLVSLEVMKSVASVEIRSELANLQMKLQNVLRIKSSIDILVVDPDEPKLQEILLAIDKGSALDIYYLSAHSDKEAWRVVIPTRVYVEGKQTYVNAWCNTSQGERVFRMDRIIKLRPNELFFEKSHSLASVKQNDSEVTLFVADTARNFLEENSRVIAKSAIVPGGVQLTLSQIDQDWLVRTVAGYGARIQILAPLSIEKAVAEHLRSINLRYKTD